MKRMTLLATVLLMFAGASAAEAHEYRYRNHGHNRVVIRPIAYRPFVQPWVMYQPVSYMGYRQVRPVRHLHGHQRGHYRHWQR